MKFHAWVKGKKVQSSWDWPKGFWKGDRAIGLAIGRLNFMLVWRTKEI